MTSRLRQNKYLESQRLVNCAYVWWGKCSKAVRPTQKRPCLSPWQLRTPLMREQIFPHDAALTTQTCIVSHPRHSSPCSSLPFLVCLLYLPTSFTMPERSVQIINLARGVELVMVVVVDLFTCQCACSLLQYISISE